FMCRKAPNAARCAKDMGYRNVYVMSAGISGWVGASLPTESGEKRDTLIFKTLIGRSLGVARDKFGVPRNYSCFWTASLTVAVTSRCNFNRTSGIPLTFQKSAWGKCDSTDCERSSNVLEARLWTVVVTRRISRLTRSCYVLTAARSFVGVWES